MHACIQYHPMSNHYICITDITETHFLKVCDMLSSMLPTSEVEGRSFTIICTVFSSSTICKD